MHGVNQKALVTVCSALKLNRKSIGEIGSCPEIKFLRKIKAGTHFYKLLSLHISGIKTKFRINNINKVAKNVIPAQINNSLQSCENL